MKSYIVLLLSCLVLLVAGSVSARGNSPGQKESKTQLSKEILHIDAIVTEATNQTKFGECVRSDGRSNDANYSTTKIKQTKEITHETFSLLQRRRQQDFDYGRYLIDKPVAMSKSINAPPYNI